MKATFVGWVTDRVPDNPALCGNGGDYFHHRKIYRLEDGRMFALFRTSADFDFCEVTGRFTEVRGVPLTIDGQRIIVDGDELWAWADRWMERRGYAVPHILSDEEIAELEFDDY